MRIALVHDWLERPGGGELVLAAFLRLFPHADIFTLVDFLTDAERARLRISRTRQSSLQHWPGAQRWFRAAVVLYPQIIERFDVGNYDLVLSDSHAIAKGIRTHDKQTHICYCHTPARFAWDMADIYRDAGLLRYPLVRNVASYALQRFRRWDFARAQDVDHYIANSAHVAALIRRCYGRAATVIHPPVDTQRFATSGASASSGDHYVTLGRLVAYKRIDLLLQAFARLPGRTLRVIGDGPEWRTLKGNAPDNVQMLGRLEDRESALHVVTATAFLHAAKEDFGIAMAEAQGAGIPVIAYRVGGAAEIVRDLASAQPTGVLFDSQSVDAIVDAIERFEKNRSRIDAAACRANAQRFVPERFDVEMRALLATILPDSSLHQPAAALVP